MVWVRIVCLVIGYLLGMFQTGYIYGRLKGIDIRQHGSGNAGTTNVKRVLGTKAGLMTYIGDVVKTILASVIVRLAFKDFDIDINMLVCYAGVGCVLGHNFPFYLNFKGGKGIAVTSAVMISLLDWRYMVVGFGAFFIVVGITRMVSLGSLSLVTGFYLAIVITTQLGYSKFLYEYRIETYLIMLVMVILAFVQHRANLVRLINGTENKLNFSKKKG